MLVTCLVADCFHGLPAPGVAAQVAAARCWYNQEVAAAEGEGWFALQLNELLRYFNYSDVSYAHSWVRFLPGPRPLGCATTALCATNKVEHHRPT